MTGGSAVTSVRSWRVDGRVLRLELVELPATRSLTGGWLTDDPVGVERSLPNLPDALPTPAGEPVCRGLTVAVAAPGVVRIRTGPVLPPLGVLVTEAEGAGASQRAPASEARTAPGSRPSDTEPAALPVVVADTGDGLVLTGPDVIVRVRRRPFGITVLDGGAHVAVRTSEHVRQTDGLPLAPALRFADGDPALSIALDGAAVHGFGEQFAAFDLRGRVLRLRVADAMGTATGLAYKPAPVWHGGGYLGFLNTGAIVRADVGHAVPDALTLAVEDATLDLFLLPHRDPAVRLERYTALTGRPPAVPDWSLGFWLGRCRYPSAEAMLAVADRLRAEDVPAEVLHCDPDWLRVDRLSCDFDWNTDRFGEPEAFVAALRERGLRLSLWELPYLDPASPLHAEALAAGHLVVDAHGEPVPMEGTPAPDGRPRAVVDLGRPETRDWWAKLHRPLLDAGVAVFKTDFGEGLPDGAALTGVPPAHAHNLYPLRYHSGGAGGPGGDRVRGVLWGGARGGGGPRVPAGGGGGGIERGPWVDLGACRVGRLAAVPGGVGRRRRRHRRGHAGDAARRAERRAVDPGVVEPRHRRLQRRPGDGPALRAVAPVRGALPDDARARAAPAGAVGVRARGPGDRTAVPPPARAVAALPAAGRGGGHRARPARAAAARPGLSRRPRRRPRRRRLPAGAGPVRRPGVLRVVAAGPPHLPPARRALARPADR